ncbi:MAG TPA: integrin alpha, partial [Polyangiaceae bacterium]
MENFLMAVKNTAVAPARTALLVVSTFLTLGACSPAGGSGPDQAPTAARTPSTETEVLGAQQSWASGVARAVGAGEYRFRAIGKDFEASNRAHDLRGRFDGSGARVSSRTAALAGEIELGLSAWGREANVFSVPRGRLGFGACSDPERLDESGACLKRLESARGAIVEWWDNAENGLEHGFEIAQRPGGPGALRLELRVSGAGVEVEANGSTALLVTKAGFSASYSGLQALDATGRELPARLVPSAGGLGIEIDDSGARYPLSVDPILTTAAWSVESNQALAWLGWSVAGAGDVNGDGYADVAIGAPGYSNGEVFEGRAFVYLGSAAGLAATPAWTAEGQQAGAAFGVPVAGVGDVNRDGFSDLVVGAAAYDGGQVDEGRVALYFGSASGLATSAAWTA